VTREQLIAAITEKARVLYEGKQVAHRSCGMAIAEAFGRETRPYHALRRGGLTGTGHCGAILAGQLVLGELLGDPGPAAPASPRLKAAITRFQAEVARRIPAGPGGTIVCNDLVAPFSDFMSEARASACTTLTATVAEIVAGVVLDLGEGLEATPLPPA
jgi:hypothetical protein